MHTPTPITLKAVIILNDMCLRQMDPAEQDSYIRKELADYFVKNIIKEDLMRVEPKYDTETDTLTITARMVFIQE